MTTVGTPFNLFKSNDIIRWLHPSYVYKNTSSGRRNIKAGELSKEACIQDRPEKPKQKTSTTSKTDWRKDARVLPNMICCKIIICNIDCELEGQVPQVILPYSTSVHAAQSSAEEMLSLPAEDEDGDVRGTAMLCNLIKNVRGTAT